MFIDILMSMSPLSGNQVLKDLLKKRQPLMVDKGKRLVKETIPERVKPITIVLPSPQRPPSVLA